MIKRSFPSEGMKDIYLWLMIAHISRYRKIHVYG